jgi:hypothetical protein
MLQHGPKDFGRRLSSEAGGIVQILFSKKISRIAAQASTFPNIRHLQNKGFAQSAFNGAIGGYAVFVNVIKSPRCAKCEEMMALRLVEPERPGFELRTFECPKCLGTETLVASISSEVDVSVAPARSGPSGS